MVVIRPVQDSHAGFWPQIVQVDVRGSAPSKELPISLTHGQFEVTKILAWNEAKQDVYFLGTLPQRPDVRHLFVVKDASTHKDTAPVPHTCLSCNLTQHSFPNLTFLNTTITDLGSKEGNNVSTCQYSRATLSKDFSHYVLDCMGPSVPHSLLFSLPDNKLVQILDTNRDLQELLSRLAMPKTKFFTYDILEDATAPARVKLLLPPGFREDEDFTFALVLRV